MTGFIEEQVELGMALGLASILLAIGEEDLLESIVETADDDFGF